MMYYYRPYPITFAVKMQKKYISLQKITRSLNSREMRLVAVDATSLKTGYF